MSENLATIEDVRKYHFDPKEVIKGLNGYYESDKCNSYITVRRNDVEGPAYLSTPIYLSALIEWLREDHDIFYRPGLTLDQVEAARNAAKMCCLRAHIKDEISKRGLWCTAEEDIPELVDTLFKAYDECSKARDRNRENAIKLSEVTQELRKELNALKDAESKVRSRLMELLRKRTAEIREVNDKRWEDLRDIYKALGCDGAYGNVDDFAKAVKARAEYVEHLSRNAERETRKAVNEQLKKDTDYVADTLCDILEALGISKSDAWHLDIPGLKVKAINRASVIKSEHDRYLEQLDKAAADYQALDKEYQKLKNSQKSDINKLIRDYCTTHGIIAPSRYFSDEACVEYVFSLLDSYSEQRNKAYDDRDRAVDDYKLNLKDYILKDIKKRGYRYNGLETKSIEEIVDWIITMATLDRSNVALRDIYTTVATPAERLRYNIDDCDGAIVDHMKDYILERFEGFNSNTEYCLKKMAELDGCQKDLKILEEQQKWLIQQNSELATKVSTKDDEISRLKGLINEINKKKGGGRRMV